MLAYMSDDGCSGKSIIVKKDLAAAAAAAARKPMRGGWFDTGTPAYCDESSNGLRVFNVS
jgi:hypothetical protein